MNKPEDKFPEKSFLEALETTKGLKAGMKPFLEAFEALNM